MPVRRPVTVPLLCAAVAALAPASAHAQASPTGGAEAAPEPEVASASAGDVSVSTRAGALLGRITRFRGAVAPAEAGRTITVERLDELTQTWSPIAHATAGRDGRYVARWKADRPGPQDVRVRVEAPQVAAAAAAPEIAVTVYKGATATWYGPGFFGHRTACGTRYTRATLGVAHRRLKCGTLVTVFYGGRSLTVPVVDRGPFRRGVTWDLTAATAQALGFTHTDTVGAMPAPVPVPQAPSR
jgi:hypothetical protein